MSGSPTHPLYDVIVVGTGAGGAPLACHLAEAGQRVLLLEAGRSWRADQYPDNEQDASLRLMWGGGLEPSKDGALALLRAKVAGGGTVVNQALLDRFDEDAFEAWRQQSGLAEHSSQHFQRYYQLTESALALESIARSDWNENARLYVEGFEQLGYGWSPLRRGQAHCNVADGNDCVRCLGGCPRQAKQSMAVTFLPRALAAGAVMEANCEIAGLVEGGQGVTVYGRQGGRNVTFHGRRCVLAAGALGSTALLLKSGYGSQLPALGHHFYCHPQFVSLALYDRNIDAHKGSFQAVKSEEPRFRAAGFKLENVFAGPLGVAFLLPQIGARHQQVMQRFRQLACIEVAVRDVTPGRISLDRRGHISVDKPLAAPELTRAKAGRQVIHDIFRQTGAEEVIDSPTNIGLHLMGGCVMGTDPRRSVVDVGFRVHGSRRVHVVDGSVFPNAPGINPSLTIMAMAHQAAEALLGQTLSLPTLVTERAS